MRPILIRVTAFSIGALVFWLLYFLRVFTAIPAGASVPSDDTMHALRMAGSLAVASGLGAFLGLGAARGASRSVPVWLAAPVGLLFGFLTLSVLGRVRVTVLPILAGMMGFLLIVAFAAAFFVWLCAMTLQLAGRHFVDIKKGIHPNQLNGGGETQLLAGFVTLAPGHNAVAACTGVWLRLTTWDPCRALRRVGSASGICRGTGRPVQGSIQNMGKDRPARRFRHVWTVASLDRLDAMRAGRVTGPL